MSKWTYTHLQRIVYHRASAAPPDKPIVWLAGEIKTPPFTSAARKEAGKLLRRVQQGELLRLPHARPMPSVGKRCYELRVVDEGQAWRIIYRIDVDAIVILEVFGKTADRMPVRVLRTCRNRLRRYDEDQNASD